jgi:hypothetical protein
MAVGLKASTGYRASKEGLYQDLKEMFEKGELFKFFGFALARLRAAII